MNEKPFIDEEKRFDSKKVLVREHTIRAGETYPMHWHDYFEFEIIISGKAEQIYNDKICSLNKGCAYLMSYYDFHSFKSIDDVRLININFGENVLSEEITDIILSMNKRFYCCFNDENTQYIAARCERIIYEQNQEFPFEQSVVSSILTEIIIMMIRNSRENTGDISGIVQKAVAKIYKRFKENISLESMAYEINVSPNYLGSQFKKSMGISFNDYINKIRLKYACSLLSSSDMGIKEVAFASGYNSIEYFFYVFKKNFLCTPGEYRKASSVLQSYF